MGHPPWRILRSPQSREGYSSGLPMSSAMSQHVSSQVWNPLALYSFNSVHQTEEIDYYWLSCSYILSIVNRMKFRFLVSWRTPVPPYTIAPDPVPISPRTLPCYQNAIAGKYLILLYSHWTVSIYYSIPYPGLVRSYYGQHIWSGQTQWSTDPQGWRIPGKSSEPYTATCHRPVALGIRRLVSVPTVGLWSAFLFGF